MKIFFSTLEPYKYYAHTREDQLDFGYIANYRIGSKYIEPLKAYILERFDTSNIEIITKDMGWEFEVEVILNNMDDKTFFELLVFNGVEIVG